MTNGFEIFFTFKVLQFNHMFAGLLVLIGQIADGFSTVFVGIFSDKGKLSIFTREAKLSGQGGVDMSITYEKYCNSTGRAY